MLDGEGGEVDSVAVEGSVAIGERPGIYLGCGDLFGQNLEPIYESVITLDGIGMLKTRDY